MIKIKEKSLPQGFPQKLSTKIALLSSQMSKNGGMKRKGFGTRFTVHRQNFDLRDRESLTLAIAEGLVLHPLRSRKGDANATCWKLYYRDRDRALREREELNPALPRDRVEGIAIAEKVTSLRQKLYDSS